MTSNKSRLTLLALWVTALLLQTQTASAGPGIADGRCSDWGDSVEQTQAQGRVDFALKCERNKRLKAQIRRHFREGLGRMGSDNVTAGYPSYGFYDEAQEDFTNPEKWYAPKTAAGDCNSIPRGYEIAYFCASGCYTPEQLILLGNGYEGIQKAMQEQVSSIMALASGSTLFQPKFEEMPVGRFITDVRPAQHTILELKTKNGGLLRLTENHPLVDGDGMIRVAASFQVGDNLVTEKGALDPISSIEKKQYFGRVYNVDVATDDQTSQIISAQGFLNGSLYYQNQGVNDLNRYLLRTTVAEHLLD